MKPLVISLVVTTLLSGGIGGNEVEAPQKGAQELLEAVKGEARPPLKEYIIEKAEEHGVDPEVALAVAICESGLDPDAYGDSKLGGSRGIWQIHAPSWPEVSDEVAYDPYLSTKWAMPKLKETPEIWTCYRNIYEQA